MAILPALGARLWNNIGIRLRTDDLIIDCDPRNYSPNDDPLGRLAEAVSADLRCAPATITSGGGRHIFREPPHLRVVGKLPGYEGLDTADRGKFIVAPMRVCETRNVLAICTCVKCLGEQLRCALADPSRIRIMRIVSIQN